MSADNGAARQDTLSRRQMLRGGFLRWLRPSPAEAPPEGGAPLPRRATAIPLLRPPGAIAEASFLTACERCDLCAEACPHGAIVATRARGAQGTPIIEPLRQPCLLCVGTPCIEACPSGALTPTARVRMGTAHINPMDCMASTGCATCAERCPVPGAIVKVDGRPRVVADACTGCGICQNVCPAPVNAVLVLPAMER